MEAYRRTIRETAPELTEAQVEGVFALWKYGLRKYGYEERMDLLGDYLALECGVRGDEFKKLGSALWRLTTCIW